MLLLLQATSAVTAAFCEGKGMEREREKGEIKWVTLVAANIYKTILYFAV